jgi:excisionase family DNA binding protein
MASQPVEGTQSRFMTVGEVAAVLRVSNMTVYRLINSGELPAVRIGRSFRVRGEDFDRYLADRFTKAG